MKFFKVTFWTTIQPFSVISVVSARMVFVSATYMYGGVGMAFLIVSADERHTWGITVLVVLVCVVSLLGFFALPPAPPSSMVYVCGPDCYAGPLR